MSDFPTFLAIEIIETQGKIAPVSIAWSLPDGQVKHTLIRPEESWGLEDALLQDIDFETLYEQGATSLEIAQELAADIDHPTIYCFDDYLDSAALDALYQSHNDDPPYELAPWQETSNSKTFEELQDVSGWIVESHSLDLALPEDRVRQMLFTYHELHQQEPDM